MYTINIIKNDDEFKAKEIINRFQFTSINEGKYELKKIAMAMPAVELVKNKKYYILLSEKLYDDKPEALFFTSGRFKENNIEDDYFFTFEVNTPSGYKAQKYESRDLILMEY